MPGGVHAMRAREITVDMDDKPMNRLNISPVVFLGFPALGGPHRTPDRARPSQSITVAGRRGGRSRPPFGPPHAGLLAVLLALSLGAPLDARAAAATASAELARVIDAQWQADLAADPLLATSVGDARYNDRLPDASACE